MCTLCDATTKHCARGPTRVNGRQVAPDCATLDSFLWVTGEERAREGGARFDATRHYPLIRPAPVLWLLRIDAIE